jgi:hypothetical protein
VCVPNGTYKSWLLTPVPLGVDTWICPEVPTGVVVEIVVDVAEDAIWREMLNLS